MKNKMFLQKAIHRRAVAYLLVLGMALSDLPLTVSAAGYVDALAAESYADGLNMSEMLESGEPDSEPYPVGTTDGGADEIMLLSDNDIASGTYEKVTWRIDSEGNLTVEGEGEFAPYGWKDRVPWYEVRTQIKTAQVKVKGMQNASYMFYGCGNLTEVDVSGFDTSKVTDMSFMFDNCSRLTSLDVSGFDTSKVTDMGSMFSGCSSLGSLDVSGFDTSKVTYMGWMFEGCSSLESLDVSGFDTSKVTNMGSMFSGCSSLGSLDVSGFDTSKVTYMGSMFSGCSSLESLDVSGFDTSKVTYMGSMFSGCSSLGSLDVSGFDTSEVTDMSCMFAGCSSLGSLDVSGFDTSNVTDMGSMFSGCSSLGSLDVSGFATSNVTYMGSMFSGCSSLGSLDVSGFATSEVTGMRSMFSGCNNLGNLDVSGFATSKVTDMYEMFFGCSSLTSLDVSGFDTSNVTSMGIMFSDCSSLESLDVSGFDTSNVTYMGWMFEGCSSLESLDVSGFDMGNVIRAENMLYNNSALSVLYTPCGVKTGMGIYIDGYEWFDVSGNTYTILPEERDYSIRLTRGEIVAEQPKLMVRPLKRRYIQNSKIEKKDLLVRYRDEEGTTRTITDGYELSVVDMSKVGETMLTVSYVDGTNMLSASVKLKVIENIPIAQGAYGDVRWEIDVLRKLTVEGTGEFAESSWQDNGAPWYEYRESIVSAEIKVKELKNARYMFHDCHNLKEISMEDFDTSEVTDMSCMFAGCSSLGSLDVSGFDTSNVTYMYSMFDGCSSLGSLDVSSFDTSEVTDMSRMFDGCSSLGSLDVSGFDTSKVTDMGFMFYGCSNLGSLDVSGFDTSKVTYMGYMFYDCSSLESLDVSGFDTSKVTYMGHMFLYCSSLERLDVSGFDTSEVTDMDHMFYYCSSLERLDVSGFDTSKVTDMDHMFYYCSSLTSLDVSGFDTSKVTDMGSMFYGCSNLTSLAASNFDTTNVIDMSWMFAACDQLENLDVGNFNTSNVADMSRMFARCRSLTSLDLSSFDMSNMPETKDMFNDMEDGALAILYTPRGVKTGMSIDISHIGNSEWHDAAGTQHAILPEGLDYSILLTRGAKPDSVQEEFLVNLLKKTYEQGSEIDPNDLIVKYRSTDGKTVVLPLKGTDGADTGYTLSAVDMNALGEKTVMVSYNNGTTVFSKEVSFKVVEKSTEPTKPGAGGDQSGSDKPGTGGDQSGSDKPGAGGTHSGSDKPGAGGDQSGSDKPGAGGDQSGSDKPGAGGTHSGSDQPGESDGSGDGSDKVEATGLHVTFTAGKTFTYTGSGIIPAIVVTNNGETLVEGVDYTVKCTNNMKTGTAKLTVTGKGRFAGKQESEFTILPKSLKDDDIAIGSLIVAENSKAAPILYYNGVKLGNKDYTLEGDTGKLALGATSPSIKVTGKGNYKDTITIGIKVVAKADLKKFGVTLGKEKLVYNGKPQQPAINLTDKGNPEKKFVEGTDYILAFNNSHTNAGTVKVTVIGVGEYSGAVTKSYKIQPRKAGDSDVTVSGVKQSYAYTGAGVTFNQSTGKLTVKYADAAGMRADLVEGKDYKVSYSANKKAGTAKYTVSFLGNYKGSKAKKGTFTITPETLNDNTVSVVVPDKVYNGKKNAYKSVPIVVDNSGNVLKKSDYTVNYYADAALSKEIKDKDNLVELGEAQNEATVYVKITGKGNYAGNTSAYAKGAYQVKKTSENVLDLSKAKVTFKQDGNVVKKLEYTGLPIEPEVTVTVKVKGVGDVTLDPSQYHVVWAGNVNKGKATAVITGNGKQAKGYAFVGSKNATITIGAKDMRNVKDLFKEALSKTLEGMFARPEPAFNAF